MVVLGHETGDEFKISKNTTKMQTVHIQPLLCSCTACNHKLEAGICCKLHPWTGDVTTIQVRKWTWSDTYTGQRQSNPTNSLRTTDTSTYSVTITSIKCPNCLLCGVNVRSRRMRGVTVHRRTTQEIPDENRVIVWATYYLKLVEL